MPSTASRQPWHPLDDRLFFDGTSDATLVTLRSKQLPLQGWAGWLDWRTEGLISHFILNGTIAAKPGEWSLLPYAPQSASIPSAKAPLHILVRYLSRDADPKSSEQSFEELGDRITRLGSHLRWAIPPSELALSSATPHLTETLCEALKTQLSQKISAPRDLFFGTSLEGKNG